MTISNKLISCTKTQFEFAFPEIAKLIWMVGMVAEWTLVSAVSI